MDDNASIDPVQRMARVRQAKTAQRDAKTDSCSNQASSSNTPLVPHSGYQKQNERKQSEHKPNAKVVQDVGDEDGSGVVVIVSQISGGDGVSVCCGCGREMRRGKRGEERR